MCVKSSQDFTLDGMRLTPSQIDHIRQATRALLGGQARITLFGSRARDEARGGDLDLLVEVARPIEEAALVSARLASRISRAIQGRKVDVLLQAPNLQCLPIHEVAKKEGVVL
jgi:predicted nucleotidyltransferase